ncbi:hypothetical protein [Siccirubricoccus sp. G192]|uniref:hypothetical protein n=1 Tax=Siccirubricoccus sp. G192 TaxID=2849651 RepID=UPI001C2C2529|nr:hypothetical protein [Siccirubricoccus sp. G192]MBV1796277.1 hypothetical protein [Siccirubricoccus sp. G192]
MPRPLSTPLGALAGLAALALLPACTVQTTADTPAYAPAYAQAPYSQAPVYAPASPYAQPGYAVTQPYQAQGYGAPVAARPYDSYCAEAVGEAQSAAAQAAITGTGLDAGRAHRTAGYAQRDCR